MDYSRNPIGDAIMIDHRYLPGGGALDFSSGKVLATAVGHWLGKLLIIMTRYRCYFNIHMLLCACVMKT